MDQADRVTRGRRRTARGRSSTDRPTEPTPAFQPITRPYTAIDVLTVDQEAHVHEMSLRLLQEVGLKFLSEKTWNILEAAGCNVDRSTGLVKFPPEVVEHHLAKAPRAFTLHARNVQHDLMLGNEHIHFGSASSAPNVIDMDRGRRPGTQADFENLVRSCQKDLS